MFAYFFLLNAIFILFGQVNAQLFYDEFFRDTNREEIVSFIPKGYVLDQQKRIHITLTLIKLDSYAILEVCNVNDKFNCFKDAFSIEQSRQVQFVKIIPQELYPEINHDSLPFLKDEYIIQVTSQYNSSFRVMVEETIDSICYQPCKGDSFCSNGQCICPQGYFGEDCFLQASPLMKLKTYYNFLHSGYYFLSEVDEIKNFQIQTCEDLQKAYIIKCASVYLHLWSSTNRESLKSIYITENDTQECFQHKNSYILLKIQERESPRINQNFGVCKFYQIATQIFNLFFIFIFIAFCFLLLIGIWNICYNLKQCVCRRIEYFCKKKVNEENKNDVDKFIPIFIYSQLIHEFPGLKENTICSICLVSFTRNITVKVTHCNHIYHEQCLNQWILMKNKKCPLCRSDLYEKQFSLAEAHKLLESSQRQQNRATNSLHRTQPFKKSSGQGVQLVNEIESDNINQLEL